MDRRLGRCLDLDAHLLDLEAEHVPREGPVPAEHPIGLTNLPTCHSKESD